VDPVRETQVSAMLSGHKLLAGDFKFEPHDETVAIVIGKRIADEAGLNLNDTLLISSTGASSLGGQQRTTLRAYVAGIFGYGNIEQDLSVYMSLTTAQVLQSLGGEVHRVSIKLTDSERIEEVKALFKTQIEQVRRRDLLDEYRATLQGSLDMLDRSIPEIEKAPQALSGAVQEAELDADQAEWAQALTALLPSLPEQLAATKAPIATAIGLDRDFTFDEPAPLEAAVAAVNTVREDLLKALSLTVAFKASLVQSDPLYTELGTIEDALGDADYATTNVSRMCHDMLFKPFVVLTWGELAPELFSLVNQERIITAMFVAMIVVVAGFIIISGLSMTVVHKKREIGIMRAMGARASSVGTIFGLSGLIIGVIGTALGTLLGLLLSYNFNSIRDWLADVAGLPRLFAPFPTVPISVQLIDLTVIWTFALVWSVLASVVPAISAARLHPAESLRWE